MKVRVRRNRPASAWLRCCVQCGAFNLCDMHLLHDGCVCNDQIAHCALIAGWYPASRSAFSEGDWNFSPMTQSAESAFKIDRRCQHAVASLEALDGLQ